MKNKFLEINFIERWLTIRRMEVLSGARIVYTGRPATCAQSIHHA